MNEPSDYNTHVHNRAPKTRVERMAWENRHSTNFNIRQAAATILVASGIIYFLPDAQSTQRVLRRYKIAACALKLRRLTFNQPV